MHYKWMYFSKSKEISYQAKFFKVFEESKNLLLCFLLQYRSFDCEEFISIDATVSSSELSPVRKLYFTELQLEPSLINYRRASLN